MSSFRFAVAALLLMMAAPRPASSQDFYQGQMVAGRQAFAAKNWVEAKDSFRIAAFGFLDRPAMLTEALAYLALAQSGLGQTDAVGETIDRFLLIETQFPSWSSARVDAGVRAQFETLLKSRAGETRLAVVPSLTNMVETEEQKLAAMDPRERKRRLELLAESNPDNPAYPVLLANAAWEDRDRRNALRWSTRALELDSSLGAMQVLRTRVLFADRKCDEAFAAEADIAADLIPADDDWKANRFVCLAEMKDWSRAAEMIPLLPDPIQDRAEVRRAIGRVNDALAKEKREAEERAKREAVVARASRPPLAEAKPNEQPASPQATSNAATTTPEPAGPAATASLARVTTALRHGQELIANGRYRDAEHHFYDAIVKDPGSRELRLALLEAATLARDWKTADSQIALVSPFADREARHLFYAAVTKWELDQRDEARELMRRAKPRLASSRYVDQYVRRILGE